MTDTTDSLGSTQRSTSTGLQVSVTDDAAADRFLATVEGAVVGRQPYRRYHTHTVLMRTEVDPDWRERGVSSAMIDGVLGLIRAAGSTVVPYCKLTSDYIIRHPEYRDMVPDQYAHLLRSISRPGSA